MSMPEITEQDQPFLNQEHSCPGSAISFRDGFVTIEVQHGFWALKIQNTWRGQADGSFIINSCPFCGQHLPVPVATGGKSKERACT